PGGQGGGARPAAEGRRPGERAGRINIPRLVHGDRVPLVEVRAAEAPGPEEASGTVQLPDEAVAQARAVEARARARVEVDLRREVAGGDHVAGGVGRDPGPRGVAPRGPLRGAGPGEVARGVELGHEPLEDPVRNQGRGAEGRRVLERAGEV